MEKDQPLGGDQPNPPPPPHQLPDDMLRKIFHRLPSDPSRCTIRVYGCTHGRLLLGGREGDRDLLLVRDPLTGEEHSIPPAPGLLPGQSCGAALICDANHAQGDDCHSSPFRVVFAYSKDYPPGGWHPPMALISTIACVYSSKTRSWGGRPAATMGVKCYFDRNPSAVVGNGAAVSWMTMTAGEGNTVLDAVLEFHLDTQTLQLTQIPDELRGDHFVLAPTMQDARVGIAGVTENCVVLFSRENGVEGWVPRIVARLDNFLPAGPAENGGVGLLRFEMGYGDEAEDELEDWTEPQVIGVSEEGGTIILQTKIGIFMVNSESGQHQRVLQADQSFSCVYPYSTFYTAAGKAVFDDVQQDQQNKNIKSGGEICALGESSGGGAD